jgi:signal transduction histidine kinase
VATMVLMVYMTSSLAREVGTREQLITDTVSRLQMANEELRRQEKVRTQFVRTVSHDLKEPLASIQSTLRVVLDGYTGEVNEKALNMIGRADKSAAKLIDMIRDMLDLGRMRSGWLGNRAVFPVADLMNAVDEKLRARAEEKHQSLTFAARPPELEINASLDALEQVLLNLVSNGLKYSSEKTPVRAWMGRENGFFVMRVEDEGIGISAEDQKQLFSEFFRAGNARRLTRDGTGLGLSIVKSIVEQHGGTIAVTSPYQESSSGTRVEVTIPWNEVKSS